MIEKQKRTMINFDLSLINMIKDIFRSFLAKTNHSPRGSSSSASIRLEHFAFVVAISVVSFGIWTFKNVFLSDVVEGSLLFFSASSNSLHNLNGKTNGNKTRLTTTTTRVQQFFSSQILLGCQPFLASF